MTNPKLMKVSDQEREAALQAISHALADGRIGYEDFEARVDRALAAQNYVELGEVVVDLPVRAPRPAREPARYPYLPINAPERPAANPADVDGRSAWPSRRMVVGVMGVRAVVGIVAAVVVVEKLVADVLPSASPVGAAGLILIAVLVTALALYNAAACRAAIPRRFHGSPTR
jgi:hypothetical protein